MANSGEFEIQIGEHTFTRSYLENNFNQNSEFQSNKECRNS